MSSLEEDLAYLRDLTRDDPGATRRTGAILIAAGIIFGLSAVRGWAHQRGMLPWAPPWIGLPPFDAILLFVVSMALIVRRYPAQPANAASRALSTALNSMGVAVVVVTVALAAAARALQDWTLFGAFPSILFAMYGSAWWVVHAVTRERWTIFVIIAAFTCALAGALLAARPEAWLVLAIGLWLVVALPGWRLLASGVGAAE